MFAGKTPTIFNEIMQIKLIYKVWSGCIRLAFNFSGISLATAANWKIYFIILVLFAVFLGFQHSYICETLLKCS